MRVFLISMITASILLLTSQAYADSSCLPLYGGGQNCQTGNVGIEKDVVNPATNSDVHDMGITDPNFSPGQLVTFHITVTNNEGNTMQSATITDNFPHLLSFQSGPGSFNTNTNVLTFQIGSIASHASQTFTVVGKVADASQFPSMQATCITNQAAVTTNDNQTAEDSSQFCVQPTASASITPSIAPPQVVSSPATGASPYILAGLIPIEIAGYFIGYKLSKKGAHTS